MEGRLGKWSPVAFPPALGAHEPAPFSLQFFLFILTIFLAELSAAILAFIFRENVRTGPRVLRPHSWPAPPSPEGLTESVPSHPVVPVQITTHRPSKAPQPKERPP